MRAIITTVAGDAPFSTVARLDGLVYRNDELIARASADGAAPLTLPEVELDDGLSYYLGGLDGAGVLVASGHGAPRLGDSKCCFTLCFCTEAVVAAGGCTCGNDLCSAEACP